jgi:hypothetical protein
MKVSLARLDWAGLLLAVVGVGILVITRAAKVPELPESTLAEPVPLACPSVDGFFGAYGWLASSKLWHAMEEPLLACGQVNLPDEAVRLTWTHPFPQFFPLSIRVERSGEHYTLTATTFLPRRDTNRRPHDYLLGSRSQRQRAVSRAEWTTLLTALEGPGFSALRRMPSMGEVTSGGDSSVWMLERRRGKMYHMVVRWSPEGGAFRSAAMALVNLAGLEDPTTLTQ